jgi:hypothetical protein
LIIRSPSARDKGRLRFRAARLEGLARFVFVTVGAQPLARSWACAIGSTPRVSTACIFDQGEYSIQVAERGFRFGVADLDPGEMGDAPDLFQGERHGD